MTVRALNNALKSILARAGIENPDGDALCILEAVIGVDRIGLVVRGDEAVGDRQSEKAIQLARRRASGEPIQYVVGSWSFMGRDYLVGEGVLIPRDDTEVVVGAALALLKPVPSPAVVDLCAGSGIIGVTLKKERPDASVAAVEKSGAAFGYLRKNAEANQAELRLICADLRNCADEFTDSSLDMIVSNPPYIPSDEIGGLQSEVQYEPRLALDGGKDGCDFYEMIVRIWSKKLKPGGYFAFEIGEEQYDRVKDLLTEHGFTDVREYPDIQGTIRAVTAASEGLQYHRVSGH